MMKYIPTLVFIFLLLCSCEPPQYIPMIIYFDNNWNKSVIIREETNKLLIEGYAWVDRTSDRIEIAIELKNKNDKLIQLNRSNFQIDSKKYIYHSLEVSDNIPNRYFIVFYCKHKDYLRMDSEEFLNELEARYIKINIKGVFKNEYYILAKIDDEKLKKRFAQR